jgi:hypothetical protein
MAESFYLTVSPASKAGKPWSSGRDAITTAVPEINSIGPPHEIHADRIIGLMLQRMVKQHSELWAAIRAITTDPCGRDGNPRAQAKLEAKIKKLGALFTDLKPGKRGRYELQIYSLAGWYPARDTLIERVGIEDTLALSRSSLQ